MVYSLLIAIWYGLSAKKAGKNVVAWFLVGGMLTYMVFAFVTKLLTFLLTGSISGDLESSMYIAVRAVGAILGILVMIVMKKKVIDKKAPDTAVSERPVGDQ